jgi:hypothetical protein
MYSKSTTYNGHSGANHGVNNTIHYTIAEEIVLHTEIDR